MKAVCIGCNDHYVPFAIVALRNFIHFNPSFTPYIIGTTFSDHMKTLGQEHKIHLIEVDLNRFFPGHAHPQYPVECFYHLYMYKLLPQYDFLVHIEPDISTSRALHIPWDTIPYVGGTYDPRIQLSRFLHNTCNLPAILKQWPPQTPIKLNQQKILPGFRVYNVKGLEKIQFFETIVDYYKRCVTARSRRGGDDSLLCLYQALHPQHIHLFSKWVHTHNATLPLKDARFITLYHMVGYQNIKYWLNRPTSSPLSAHFARKAIQFLKSHFSKTFVETYFPLLTPQPKSGKQPSGFISTTRVHLPPKKTTRKPRPVIRRH